MDTVSRINNLCACSAVLCRCKIYEGESLGLDIPLLLDVSLHGGVVLVFERGATRRIAGSKGSCVNVSSGGKRKYVSLSYMSVHISLRKS